MAIYHCSVKAISRSAGRSATAAAAYRSAGRIEDERQGMIHDYTRKGGVVVTGIAVPDGVPDWARDRSTLWNAAEAAERRKNSTVAREVEVALPQELDAGQMRSLVEEYSRWLSTRYGVAVDWAIHQPHRRGDERNHHAHILMTTRVMGTEGLGAKVRVLDAKETGPAEVLAMREQWAEVVNRALEQAGLDVRVDHRRLEEQGIEREPQIHAGPSVTAMERKAAAPDPEPLGVIDAIARTGGTTTVGQRLASIVEINSLREERERQRIRAQERKAAAWREMVASHREPVPDRLAIGQTVAAWVAEQARQQRADVQRRWDARKRQRREQARDQRRREAQEKAQQAQRWAQALREHGQQLRAQQIKQQAQAQLAQRWAQELRDHERQQRERQAQLEAEAKAQREAEALREQEERQRAEECQAQKAIREPRHSPVPIPMLSEASPRKKTPWREWREATLTQRYGEDVAAKAVREDWYIRMRPDLGGLNIVVTDPKGGRREIVDGGDIVRSEGDGIREIPLMLALAQAKGWSTLKIEGSDAFREQAALEAVKMGFALEDRTLEKKARECLEAEAREREVKRVTLAEFGARRGEVLAVSDDRTTLTLYCPKTDEILQVDTGGKRLPDNLQPGHFVDASRNYLSGGLNIKAAPMPTGYKRRIDVPGPLPRLDSRLKR